MIKRVSTVGCGSATGARPRYFPVRECVVHDESSALIYIGIVCLAMGVCVAAGCFFVNYKV